MSKGHPYSDHSGYVGLCSKCGELRELDTSTALCEKCSDPKTKKEGKDGG